MKKESKYVAELSHALGVFKGSGSSEIRRRLDLEDLALCNREGSITQEGLNGKVEKVVYQITGEEVNFCDGRYELTFQEYDSLGRPSKILVEKALSISSSI